MTHAKLLIWHNSLVRIPDFFWAQSQKEGESLLDVGARNASSETENFSYRNSWLVVDDEVAGCYWPTSCQVRKRKKSCRVTPSLFIP